MAVLDKITKALSVIAPTVAGVVVPGSGPMVQSLMRAVTGASNSEDIEEVAKAIEADPKLYVELQKVAMEREVSLKSIEAQKLKAVNETMQAEAKSEKWPQYSWRPFNGFSFPVAVIAIYFVLPLLAKTVPDIPQWVWIGWLSILGVATYDRGKEKRAKAGEQKQGLLPGLIEAIRR